MNISEWAAQVVENLTDAPVSGEIVTKLRSRLVELSGLATMAPDAVNTAFIELNEVTLRKLTAIYWDELSDGEVRWPADVTAALPEEVVLHLAAIIRAIDEYLVENGSLGPMNFPSLMDHEKKHWIVPRKWPRPIETLQENQGYRRRGLRFHRIIPTTLSGYQVRLHPMRMLATNNRAGSKDTEPPPPIAKLSANAFDKLKLEWIKTGTTASPRFVATGVTTPDHDLVVRQQVEASLAGGASIVAWPELTMPPKQQAIAIATLKEMSLEAKEVPQIVVLGSWHETDGAGKIVNGTTIVNGLGQQSTQYNKMVPYYSKPTGREDIVPGAEIVVLISDEFMATPAICKDFCELPRSAMFRELDIDLFIVPSMSDSSTMGSHQTMAKDLRVVRGSWAFVVQQPDDPGEQVTQGGWALVLPAPRDPAATGAVRPQSTPVHLYESTGIL